MTVDESGLVQHLGYSDSLNVAISICLTYTLIFTCIRIHLRRSSFGPDDAVVIIATITALVHFATSYAALTAGLGKPYGMLKGSLSRLSSTVEASAITFILSLYTAKIAALVFLMRIESKTRNPRLYYALIGICTLFGIGSAICVSASCPAGSGFYFDLAGNSASCPSEYTRWQVMTALDILSEVVLLALPVHLVYPLQMPRARKIIVVATFWTRFPTIALSIIRQTYTDRLRQSGRDKSLGSTIVVVLMAVEVTYTLIACTLSTSKNFTDGFNTGWGMGHIRGAAESYNLSHVGGSGSGGRTTRGQKSTTATIDTHDMRSSMERTGERFHRKTPSYEYEDQQGLQLRPAPGMASQTTVQAEQRNWGENGSVSSESDDLVILRHTEYTVSHDEAPILQKHNI